MSPQSASTAVDAPAPATVPRSLVRRWWWPSAFVAAALLLLLIEALVVHRRVEGLRQGQLDVSDQARVLVNDLEAAFATESYARDERSPVTPAQADSILRTTLADERSDMRGLDSLVRLIGPVGVSRFQTLRGAAAAWHAGGAAPGQRPRQAAIIGSVPERRPELLSAAESLDRYLATVTTSVHERMRQYVRLDVLFAIVLVPLGLAAVGVVLWSGHRMLTLAHTLERERAALAESIRLRAVLMHGVTHDVKNPLGAAMGYAELLEEGVDGELRQGQRDMVRRMRRLMDTALHTITELLDVASRADADHPRVDPVITDLAPIIEEVGEDFRAAARAKHITLAASVPAAPLVVATDATRVRRILENLLSNAVKYTPPGGQVVVRAVGPPPSAPRAPGATAAARPARNPVVGIVVEDSGPGVPAGLRSRIFEEFYRGPGTGIASDGNGVGLATSRQFARALGGDIEVRESAFDGAAFTLWLPG